MGLFVVFRSSHAHPHFTCGLAAIGISGLVVEYIVAIDVTWVQFPADALFSLKGFFYEHHSCVPPTIETLPATKIPPRGLEPGSLG